MSEELCHEALAECHDFSVTLALRVKIGTALAAADRKTCQGILEDLLKAEELDDTEVYRRMKSETALVRADRGIELYSHRVVDLDLSLIVDPRYAEEDLALRCRQSLKESFFAIFFFVCLDDDAEGLKDFLDCLMEFRLSRVLGYYAIIDFINI